MLAIVADHHSMNHPHHGYQHDHDHHHHHHHLQQQEMLPATNTDGFAADGGGLLFKKVTPRKRQDQFGRDQTRHADYLLSMAVFPTGVRAPLLSQLQEKTQHQCGFEVVDKGDERRRRGGRHVCIRDSLHPVVCLEAKPCISVLCQVVDKGDERRRRGGRHVCIRDSLHPDDRVDSAKKPPPNTPLTASVKLTDRTHLSQSVSSITPRTSKEPGYRWVNASTPGTRASSSHKAGEGPDCNSNKQKDIRDPLYLNTYCPGERTLRYKKTSLPRISNRTRPWTVSEPNPSYRFARNSQDVKDKQSKAAWGNNGGQGTFRIHAHDVKRAKPRGSAHAHADEAEEGDQETETVSQTGSRTLLQVKSYFPHADLPMGDQRDALKGKDGCLHSKVKQCIRFVKYRDKLARSVERPLKQEGGRYRPFSSTIVRTPRQLSPSAPQAPHVRHPDPTSVEIYKEYIDTIALQTRLVSAADKRRKPRPALSAGVPRYNTAASSYRGDGGNSTSSALQSVAESNRPPVIINGSVNGSVIGNNHGASISLAAEKVQSARAPLEGLNLSGSARGAGGGGTDRGGGGGSKGEKDSTDPLGVHQALDIIRLSPKAQPLRSSRGTARGGRSNRGGEGGEEGGDGGGEEGMEGGEGEKGLGEKGEEPKIHAIFLPHVSKSATTSVCSFVDDGPAAPET